MEDLGTKSASAIRGSSRVSFSRQGKSSRRATPGEDARCHGRRGVCREEPLTRGRRASRRLARANSAYPRLPFLEHEKPIARASITEAATVSSPFHRQTANKLYAPPRAFAWTCQSRPTASADFLPGVGNFERQSSCWFEHILQLQFN